MTKKKQFMELYGPVHGSFERFCKARYYGICDFNDLMHDTLVIAFEQFENLKSKEAFLRLATANHKLKQIQEFHFLRTAREKDQQVSDQLQVIQEIEDEVARIKQALNRL